MYNKGIMENKRDIYKPQSKYFSILSGMTTKEVRDFAKKYKIRGRTTHRGAELTKFLDREFAFDPRKLLNARADLERQMFKNTLRAWVGLFVSDKSVAEHYTQIIFHTLSSIKRKKPKPEEFKPQFEFYYVSDSEEDIPDGH